MALKKGDFIEIDFTGKIKDSGEIFDTTTKEDAKKANLDIKNLKSFAFCVGEKMLPNGFDSDFIGKEVGKSYVLNLKPKDAFGSREKNLVKMVPTKLFLEQKIHPERGMQLNIDGQVVRILSVSGGRTLVDFNNPLAGKEIIYEYTINKQIIEEKEKVDSISEFLFRRKLNFKVDGNKIVYEVEKNFEPIIKMFSSKIKEILGKDVETKIVEKDKTEKAKKDVKEIKKEE